MVLKCPYRQRNDVIVTWWRHCDVMTLQWRDQLHHVTYDLITSRWRHHVMMTSSTTATAAQRPSKGHLIYYSCNVVNMITKWGFQSDSHPQNWPLNFLYYYNSRYLLCVQYAAGSLRLVLKHLKHPRMPDSLLSFIIVISIYIKILQIIIIIVVVFFYSWY